MKIHLRQIPEEGLHIEGEEAGFSLDLPAEDPVRALGPLRYSLDLGVSSDGLWATGELEIELELECVRCLEKFSYPLTVPDVALQMELPGRETIDLTPALREDILLALPAYPHCDWSGERVCPGRQEAKEDAASAEGAGDSPRAPSAWEVLDQIRKPAK